ncbi:transposase [Pelagibius sp. CAU 1746]|uniref:transposase n=1 Tax=Pelagibius sp. CAU 1746 TaxID=3140370 RepID=UPI00325A78FB
MARPLRLELPGAVYHLTTLGNAGQTVFRAAEDSELFLEIVGQACERFDWRCLAYCLLPDRYHLVVETRRATLARGMRQINGRYTQAFNRRHGVGGHLFQGRYRAVMVEKPGFVAAVCRDVLRRPLELGLAEEAAAWRWSSCRALLGRLPSGRSAPDWLAVDDLLGLYAGASAAPDLPAPDLDAPDLDAPDLDAARRRCAADIAADRPSVWESLRHQVFLGSEDFVVRMRERAAAEAAGRGSLAEIPKAQWQAPPPPLQSFAAQAPSREEAMARAYLSGAYSQNTIAAHFGVHYSTVSRAVRRFEKDLEERAAS